MADRMFGLIAAGRPPEIFKQVEETEFLCKLEASESVNHLVVFMTGSEVFPEGYGASGKTSSLFGGNAYMDNLGTVQVGIKVESLQTIESLQAESSSKATTQTTLAEFADKMVQNLVNHAESYATRLPKSDGLGYTDYIPINALQEWVTNFSRRFKQNPYFWKSLQNN